MFEYNNKKKYLIIIIVCVIILIFSLIIYSFMKENNENEDEFIEEIENKIDNNIIEVENTEKIIVHITGQVISPGVISLNKSSRVIDAINIAGGVTEKANLEKVNLAYILEDAQKIYIPSVEENSNTDILEEIIDAEIVTSGSGNDKNKKENIMININTANEEELQKLSGIGSSIAIRIIEYRKQYGKFNTIEDIKNVNGIGDSKFDNIKNNIFIK